MWAMDHTLIVCGVTANLEAPPLHRHSSGILHVYMSWQVGHRLTRREGAAVTLDEAYLFSKYACHTSPTPRSLSAAPACPPGSAPQALWRHFVLWHHLFELNTCFG